MSKVLLMRRSSQTTRFRGRSPQNPLTVIGNYLAAGPCRPAGNRPLPSSLVLPGPRSTSSAEAGARDDAIVLHARNVVAQHGGAGKLSFEPAHGRAVPTE